MNTKKVIIEEKGLDIPKGKELILRSIKNQIQDYKQQLLTNWEQDHNISQKETKVKIEELKKTKEAIEELLNNSYQNDQQVDVNINIEFAIKDKVEQTTMEESMVI